MSGHRETTALGTAHSVGRVFSFIFPLFLHPAKSRLNELYATELYPRQETLRDSKCAHQKAPSGITGLYHIPKETWKLGLEGHCVVSNTVKDD